MKDLLIALLVFAGLTAQKPETVSSAPASQSFRTGQLAPISITPPPAQVRPPSPPQIGAPRLGGPSQESRAVVGNAPAALGISQSGGLRITPQATTSQAPVPGIVSAVGPLAIGNSFVVPTTSQAQAQAKAFVQQQQANPNLGGISTALAFVQQQRNLNNEEPYAIVQFPNGNYGAVANPSRGSNLAVYLAGGATLVRNA